MVPTTEPKPAGCSIPRPHRWRTEDTKSASRKNLAQGRSLNNDVSGIGSKRAQNGTRRRISLSEDKNITRTKADWGSILPQS